MNVLFSVLLRVGNFRIIFLIDTNMRNSAATGELPPELPPHWFHYGFGILPAAELSMLRLPHPGRSWPLLQGNTAVSSYVYFV